MAVWFWYFLIYSFLGYCLEKLFARAIHSPHQVRKCFLLLPLCPVYGLAMAAVLALAGPQAGFFPLVLLGGLVCTAVEYLVHLAYDRLFATRFWDYSRMRWHIRGRVSLIFSLVWGLLSALAVSLLQPSVVRLVRAIPAPVTFALWLLLAADCVLTGALLLRFHDPEGLTVSGVLSQIRASSQSSTSR